MELLPVELRKTLPPLYSQESCPAPIAHVKLFTPDSSFTWYVTEGAEQEDGDWLLFVDSDVVLQADALSRCVAAACLGLVVFSLATGCDRLPGKPKAAARWMAPAQVTDFTQLYAQNCAVAKQKIHYVKFNVSGQSYSVLDALLPTANVIKNPVTASTYVTQFGSSSTSGSDMGRILPPAGVDPGPA